MKVRAAQALRVDSRYLAVFFVLALSAVLGYERTLFERVPNEGISVWPSQVIFGFYFVILVLAVQGLQPQIKSEHPRSPKQRLFLLASIGLCSDLVTVNY